MSDGHESTDRPSDEERADRVAELATSRGLRVAAAESLTAGRISSFLGRGEEHDSDQLLRSHPLSPAPDLDPHFGAAHSKFAASFPPESVG